MAFKYCPKYANSFNLQKNLNTYKDSKELCDKLFFMIIYLETHTHVAELVPTDLPTVLPPPQRTHDVSFQSKFQLKPSSVTVVLQQLNISKPLIISII